MGTSKELRVEAIRKVIAEWLKSTSLSQAYVFGSLVHKNGAHFNMQSSDVDIICRFKDDSSYLLRWEAITSARNGMAELNLRLLSTLGRNDASKPIVSLVPVSEFELEMGIHKDKAPQFFSHNTFLCVESAKTKSIGKEYRQISPQMDGALDSVREAQRFRNKALSAAPNGGFVADCHEGLDVFPKTFARCAAQVRWARQSQPVPDQRFDLNEGTVYSLQLLTARRNESHQVEDLLQRVIVRMNGRGEPSGLSVNDQILLWELLADDVAGLVTAAENSAKRSKIRKLNRRMAAKIRAEAFGRAGMKCEFPGCGVPLGEGGIGEIAHIASPSPRGPRYESTITVEQADSLENILVLCPTHHRMIDASPELYPAKMIRAWRTAAQAEPHPAVFNSRDLFTMVRLIMRLLISI